MGVVDSRFHHQTIADEIIILAAWPSLSRIKKQQQVSKHSER